MAFREKRPPATTSSAANADLEETGRLGRLCLAHMGEGFTVHEMIYDAAGRPVDYRFLDVNPAFEQMTGLARQRVVGRTVLEVLPGIEPFWIETYAKVAETGTPLTFEQRAAQLGKWFEVRAFSPERGKFAVLFLDITERKRAVEALRSSERLYRAIGESIDYGVWVCDPEGRNTYASESFLELVGMTQEQCSSFGWGDVLHPDDAARTIAAWKECVRSGGTWDIEHRYRGADGRWHPILARGVAVRNDRGEVVAWAGINLDISRLKETEAALREADRRKDEFLAVLSHELRNPLAPIRNSLYVLQRAAPGSEQASKAQAVIDRQVGHLTRLVDDLLDATRIARGKVHLQREGLDLKEVVQRTVEDHRPVFVASGVALQALTTTQPLWVDGDVTRIAQIVGNVLNNAVKFTPAGGRVAVKLTSEGAAAVLRVEDTGVGIALEQLGSVFDTFSQADQALDRKLGGLGLGLALVKGFVELHGGTVEAASEGVGRGTTITVRLPVQAAPAGEATSLPLAAPSSRLRVLVIEDNEDAADSLRDALELEGHEVAVAHSGPAGVNKAKELLPEVVLCDVGLPEMDGYAVARALRAEPGLRGVFLVALTGYALPEDVSKALESGFDRHLAKPPRLETLTELLAEVGKAERQ